MPRPPIPLLAALCLFGCHRASGSDAVDGRHRIAISVDAVGYHPAESHAKAGEPLRLVFTRTTDDGCGQDVVIPSANVKRALPLNQPVSIDVTMPAQGPLAFACGMDMLHGSVTPN